MSLGRKMPDPGPRGTHGQTPGVSEEPAIGTGPQQGFLEMESDSWRLAAHLGDAEGALACVLTGGLLGTEGAHGCLRTDRLTGKRKRRD